MLQYTECIKVFMYYSDGEDNLWRIGCNLPILPNCLLYNTINYLFIVNSKRVNATVY